MNSLSDPAVLEEGDALHLHQGNGLPFDVGCLQNFHVDRLDNQFELKNVLASSGRLPEGTGKHRPDICAADLRREDGCKAVFRLVSERHSRCDILVNSAGATRAGAFLDLSEDAWHDGFALKFFGCVSLCRLFWPLLRTTRGHVVNIIGGAARTPDPEFLIGGSVNAAMHNFSKGLSGLGKRDGITVNAILPGMTETERVEQLFKQRAAASGKSG